jgi:hypothetical protein
MSARLLPAATGLLIIVLATLAPPARAASADVLPDLDQESPTALAVTRAPAGQHRKWLLGFGSAVRNVGAGPLVIDGHRSGRRVSRMVADQLVRRAGASDRRVRGVGHLRFVVSPDHRHWHYIGFERYALRGVDEPGAVRRGHKSGFCLGDRYPVTAPVLPAASATPVFTSRCGLGQRGRLRVREGISVGYGDYYGAGLEGQYITLDGLPDGRYTLVHRVNVDRRLREQRYDNDAASVLLSLHWHAGLPYLRVLAHCEDSARCTPANAATRTGTSVPAAVATPCAGSACCCTGWRRPASVAIR